jgi:hypothetical protein
MSNSVESSGKIARKRLRGKEIFERKRQRERDGVK